MAAKAIEPNFNELAAFADTAAVSLGANYAAEAGLPEAPGPIIQFIMQIIAMLMAACPLAKAEELRAQGQNPGLFARWRLWRCVKQVSRDNPDTPFDLDAAQAAIMKFGKDSPVEDYKKMQALARMTATQ